MVCLAYFFHSREVTLSRPMILSEVLVCRGGVALLPKSGQVRVLDMVHINQGPLLSLPAHTMPPNRPRV